MAKCNRKRKDPLPEVLIITEGEKTEPAYLKDVKDYLKSTGASGKKITRLLQITDNGKKTSPRKILETAIKERKSGVPYVFIVIDDDDRKESRDVLAESLYPQTVPEVSNDKINCIYSNPCFEYWALLHFSTSEKECASGELTEILSKYMPLYSKRNKVFIYNAMQKTEDKAAKLATKIRQNHQLTGKAWDRPSTNVDVLLAFIKEHFKV